MGLTKAIEQEKRQWVPEGNLTIRRRGVRICVLESVSGSELWWGITAAVLQSLRLGLENACSKCSLEKNVKNI